MKNQTTKPILSLVTLRKLLLLVLPFFGTFSALAQSSEVEMADALRQDGKIYVVVASIVVIVGGLVLFLIRLDGKLSRLEKENQTKP
jgi:hypothetical protein